MTAFWCNLLHVGLAALVMALLWRRNSILVYYMAFALFLVLIPLTFDSAAVAFGDLEGFIDILYQNNPGSINDFSWMSVEVVEEFSRYAFVFDIALVFAFVCLGGWKVRADRNALVMGYFPPAFYAGCSVASVLLFYWLYGFGFDDSYAENSVGGQSFLGRLGTLAFYFTLMASYIGCVAGLARKKWHWVGVSLAQVVCIAALSRARALFVPFLLLLIFVFIERLRTREGIRWLRVASAGILIGVLALVITAVFAHEDIGVYPLWRDFCLQDGYFCFARHSELATDGSNLKFLAMTWIPFIDKPEYIDITRLVPDLKFGMTFGATLHVTHYAWFYTDLGGTGIASGLLLGVVIAVLERLRLEWLPEELSTLLLAFALGMVPTFVRGSVSYAVTNVIYQFLMFFFCAVCYNTSKRAVSDDCTNGVLTK